MNGISFFESKANSRVILISVPQCKFEVDYAASASIILNKYLFGGHLNSIHNFFNLQIISIYNLYK